MQNTMSEGKESYRLNESLHISEIPHRKHEKTVKYNLHASTNQQGNWKWDFHHLNLNANTVPRARGPSVKLDAKWLTLATVFDEALWAPSTEIGYCLSFLSSSACKLEF